MTQKELLREFQRLSLQQQLAILRDALEIVENNFRQLEQTESDKLPLEEAAQLLRQDYLSDSELTAFTAIDGDEFHAAW
ncbi:MAG: hypothetical protein KC449_28235 [Anaerolineales bacterium]|nr:hypothetical protein [Anaerolineales bacterium]